MGVMYQCPHSLNNGDSNPSRWSRTKIHETTVSMIITKLLCQCSSLFYILHFLGCCNVLFDPTNVVETSLFQRTYRGMNKPRFTAMFSHEKKTQRLILTQAILDGKLQGTFPELNTKIILNHSKFSFRESCIQPWWNSWNIQTSTHQEIVVPKAPAGWRRSSLLRGWVVLLSGKPGLCCLGEFAAAQ